MDGQAVGGLALETRPTTWPSTHAAEMGMAVRDDWQGKEVGTASLRAALDLADNWLNLTRVELRVYIEPGVTLDLSIR